MLYMPAVSAEVHAYSAGGTLSCIDPITGQVHCKLVWSLDGYIGSTRIEFRAWLYTYFSPTADEYDVDVAINEQWTWWIFSGWSASGDWQPNQASWYTRNQGPQILYYSMNFYDVNTAKLKQYQITVQAWYISIYWDESATATLYWQL
jgi:hypothetical protein